MTDAFIAIIVAGLLAISSVLALRLPQGLAPADVAAFLTACTGMRARRWQRPFVVRALVLETVATSEGVVHHLAVPAGFAEIVLGALRATVPGAAAGRIEAMTRLPLTLAAEVGQSGWRKPLVTGQATRISTALLATLQPLHNGERIVVQWVLAPTGPLSVPVVASGRTSKGSPTLARVLRRLFTTPPVDAATAQQIRAKQAAPLLSLIHI